jgi:hypothetical protein
MRLERLAVELGLLLVLCVALYVLWGNWTAEGIAVLVFLAAYAVYNKSKR